MKRKYDEASVVRALNKKQSIKVDTVNGIVKVQKNATDVGNSSWGKIDYLCHYCGYIYIFVNFVFKKNVRQTSKTENTDIINKKVAKRENKLNMAAMIKNAMKKVIRK